jgi:HEAT repeat protein
LAIRASSSRQIAALVADLSAADDTTREAAAARLTVMGARAVEPLLTLAMSAAADTTRAIALRTLEGTADPRALTAALQLLEREGEAPAVAAAAARVARVFVRGANGALAVDKLTAAALDPRRPSVVRVAALSALGALDPATLSPLLASLASDPDMRVRAEASSASEGRRPAGRPIDLAALSGDGELPSDPDALRRAFAHAKADLPLPALLRVLERVREREASEPAARRQGWTAARAAAHLALANRGSRLAVYDLRESLEAARAPLPVEMLAALSIIGDASCVEAIAGAHARAKDAWWRDHLADAFRTIVAREKLTRRHAAVKKAEKKYAKSVDALWPARSQ